MRISRTFGLKLIDNKAGEKETKPSQKKPQPNSQASEQTNDQTKNNDSKESAQSMQNHIDFSGIIDPMNEGNIMIEISKHGLCQPVYAKYNNGE